MILEGDSNQDELQPAPVPLPQTVVTAVAGGPGAPPRADDENAMSPMRAFLRKRGSSNLADRGFMALMALCSCSIFAIVAFIATILVLRSRPTLADFGWKFFSSQQWDPVSGDFGALPFIYGTVVSSLLA